MDDINTLQGHDESMNAIFRKATSPAPSQRRGERQNGGVTPTRTELTAIAGSRMRTIRNAERIFQALPELETIVTIAVSSLLSTKDLVTTTLVYECLDDDIPLELRSLYLDVIRTFFNDEDKLPTNLYNWMYDAYRSKGASPQLIVSDTGFDNMFGLSNMTVASESVRRALAENVHRQQGFLRTINPDKKLVGLEAILSGGYAMEKPQTLSLDVSRVFKSDDLKTHEVHFTDNPNITQLSLLQRHMATENARRSLEKKMPVFSYNDGTGAGMQASRSQEAINNMHQPHGMIDPDKLMGPKDLNPQYDRQGEQKQYNELAPIDGSTRDVMEPIRLAVPPECAMPVTLAGNVRDPLGFLVIIDGNGNFVNSKSTIYNDATFMNYLSNDGMADSTINRAALGLNESSLATPEIAAKIIARYGELAEDQMTRAISNGLGGGDISLSITEDFGRIMFGRHLAKEYTQVLYVPAENMPYFATDFNDDGIGVSITERSFVISTVRMALLFATMQSSILNSARNMQFDIELSPEDRNGQETVDKATSDIMNSYNRRLPTWGSMEDTFSMATNAGIAINVVGNEYYPSSKVSISDTTPDYKMPDIAYDENLLRRTCHIADVDPDLVLTPDQIEFASQIYSKSLLVTQKVAKKQEILSKPITQYVVTYTQASPNLRKRLVEATVEWMKEADAEALKKSSLLEDIGRNIKSFLKSLRVRIPSPDTSAASSQMDQFDKRLEFIEKVVDQLVSDDNMTLLTNNGIVFEPDQLKSLLKTYYMRQWMRNNDIEGAFFDLLYDKDKRQDNVKAISDDVVGIGEFLMQLATKVTGKTETAAKRLGQDGGAATDDAFGGGGGGEDTGFSEGEDDEMDDFDTGGDGDDGEDGGDGDTADSEDDLDAMDDVTDDDADNDADANANGGEQSKDDFDLPV